MNHATLLAVLALMSFTLPLIMRLLPMLNPNVLMLLSLAFVLASVWQLWQTHSMKQSLKTLKQEESSSPILKSLTTEEDYHASL